ncbi:hypothetical protein POUND7_000490 [Theobroma cacao]
MAEAIVSAILLELAAIAIENAREEWRLVTGVDKEVERLKSNLEAIQCELEDAEEKQFINKRVQHWLDRFKQVAYDMEDVLDDWKTALDKLQTDGAETSSVPKRKEVVRRLLVERSKKTGTFKGLAFMVSSMKLSLLVLYNSIS